MAHATDFPARGKVISVRDGVVRFSPAGTNYELHLIPEDRTYDGPTVVPAKGSIRVEARKLWTVPSGGNFIALSSGPPRTIQGPVRYLDEQTPVVQAVTFVIIALPPGDTAYDLAN